MNLFVETLNHFGSRFAEFALPMLGQSSLLIAFLFVLDLLISKRVRAVVRYGLWMLVLVKLLMPPSFASPTGLAYWLPEASSTKMPSADLRQSEVSYSDIPFELAPVFTAAPAPRPKLRLVAWTVLGWLTFASGLSLLLIRRSRLIAKSTRRSFPAPVSSERLLKTCCHGMKIRRRVRLRISDDTGSPAVWGLWRPVILLPQPLANKLSNLQLRAVLLHELAHIKRHDVLAHYAQTLLQIFYWWHPLLWFANARIRRVREQAVDEMVMVEMRPEIDVYPTTLLEVAKLTFLRPGLVLGLIGIVATRSALAQRIQRLLTLPVPKSAKIGWVRLALIFLIGAVLLPMARSAQKSVSTTPVSSHLTRNSEVRSSLSVNLAALPVPFLSPTLDKDLVGVSIPATDNTGATKIGSMNTPATELPVPGSEGVRLDPWGNPFVITEELKGHDNVPGAFDGLSTTPQTLPFSKIEADGLANTKNQTSTPETAKPNRSSIEQAALGPPQNPDQTQQLETRIYRVDPRTFQRGTESVVIFPLGDLPQTTKGDSDASGETRTHLDRKVLDTVRAFFASAGVNVMLFNMIFFNDHTGVLMVRATPLEFDIIQKAIDKLNILAQQITIEARFMELSSQAIQKLGLDVPPPGRSTNNWARVLTAAQMRKLLLHKTLQQEGADVLSAPSVTTLSGRATQIQTVEMKTIVSAAKKEALTPPGIRSTNGIAAQPYLTAQIASGPTLEVTPFAAADGYTIHLDAHPRVTEFLGYDIRLDDAGKQRLWIDGHEESGALPLPRVRTRQLQASLDVYDGQTLVLGNPVVLLTAQQPDGQSVTNRLSEDPGKRLLVFVTPRLIDPAGQPIHSRGNEPFRVDEIPPPPAQ